MAHRKPKIGGVAPYGYRFADEKLVADPVEAPVRKLAFESFLEFRSKGAVAEKLNSEGYRTRRGEKWRDVQVDRMLTCSSAIGEYFINKTRRNHNGKKRVLKPESEWIHVECEPIISMELWMAVQEQLKSGKNPQKQTGGTPLYTFTGLVFCECGEKMRVRSSSPRYACQKCPNKIAIADLESAFQKELAAFVKDEVNESHLSQQVLCRWPTLTVGQRREIALAFIDKLVVGRGKKPRITYRFPGSVKDPAHPQHTIRPTDAPEISAFSDAEAALTSTLASGEPRYIRIPRSGETCPHSGLKRSVLYKLISPFKEAGGNPVVESVSVKKPGQHRGTRLIVWSSLKAYLKGQKAD